MNKLNFLEKQSGYQLEDRSKGQTAGGGQLNSALGVNQAPVGFSPEAGGAEAQRTIAEAEPAPSFQGFDDLKAAPGFGNALAEEQNRAHATVIENNKEVIGRVLDIALSQIAITRSISP